MAARMSKGANREDCAAGPAQGEGLGANKIKGIFDGIRIFDWQT